MNVMRRTRIGARLILELAVAIELTRLHENVRISIKVFNYRLHAPGNLLRALAHFDATALKLFRVFPAIVCAEH